MCCKHSPTDIYNKGDVAESQLKIGVHSTDKKYMKCDPTHTKGKRNTSQAVYDVDPIPTT